MKAAFVEVLAAPAVTEGEEATMEEEAEEEEEEAEVVCADEGRGPTGKGVEDELAVAEALAFAFANAEVPEVRPAVAEVTEAATGATIELEMLAGVTSALVSS